MRTMVSTQGLGVLTEHLHAAIITTDEQFEALREDWNRLFQQDEHSIVFQSYAWCRTCWAHQDRSAQLAIVVIYENGQMIGIAPLMAKRRFPGVSQIEPLDCGQLAYFRPIAPEGRDDVAEAMALALASAFPAGVVHIPYYDAGDRGTNVLLATLATLGWGKASWPRNISHYIHQPGGYAQYLALKSSKSRNNLKRWRKKLEEQGQVRIERFSGNWKDEHAVERMAAIQQRSWLIRRGQHPINSPFNREMILALGEEDLAEVFLLSIDHVDVAYILNLCTPALSLLYYLAFDERFAALTPGKVLLEDCIETTLNRGVASYDFLFGEGEYKRFWANRTRCVMRAVGYKGLRGWLAAWLPHRLHGTLARRAWLRRWVSHTIVHVHKLSHRLRRDPKGGASSPAALN